MIATMLDTVIIKALESRTTVHIKGTLEGKAKGLLVLLYSSGELVEIKNLVHLTEPCTLVNQEEFIRKIEEKNNKYPEGKYCLVQVDNTNPTLFYGGQIKSISGDREAIKIGGALLQKESLKLLKGPFDSEETLINSI